MSTSYNGWYASPDLAIRPLSVAGEFFIPGVLDDPDVHTVLQWLAQQLHERVEPIERDNWHQSDDWGFSYRASTGDPNALSCHASGTAFDYNATRHPYGVPASANFTPAQIAEIHQILEEGGVIVWGGDWNNADAMHFEISGNAAEVAAAADRIRNKQEEAKMAIYEDELRRIEEKADKALVKLNLILQKQEGSREREVRINKQLRDLRDSSTDLAQVKKLDAILALLDEE